MAAGDNSRFGAKAARDDGRANDRERAGRDDGFEWRQQFAVEECDRFQSIAWSISDLLFGPDELVTEHRGSGSALLFLFLGLPVWRRDLRAARGAGVCARSAACCKSGINRSRANDGCLPPPDADGSGVFRVSDQPRRGGAYHLVRGVLVRSGAEDLQPWCSCLCRPRRRRRLGLALLCGHRRCCGHSLGGDFVGAAVSGHSSAVGPSCCTTGTGSRCPQVSGFVQRPATSPTLFAQIMFQRTRMPEIPGARAGPYRCRPGLRSLKVARPRVVASIDELDRGDPVARDRVSGVRG